MSLVTYTKSYRSLVSDNVIIYTDFNRKITNVFYEIVNSIKNEWTFDQIKKFFENEFKPESRSKFEIEITDTHINFYKPNCSVFPVVYVTNKNV